MVRNRETISVQQHAGTVKSTILSREQIIRKPHTIPQTDLFRNKGKTRKKREVESEKRKSIKASMKGKRCKG